MAIVKTVLGYVPVFHRVKAYTAIRWEKTEATRAITMIMVLRESPAVSLNGSPTASPTTAALCSRGFCLTYLIETVSKIRRVQ